ncbi:hypothetical protein F0562_005211 [Nyssa sinensis]|uniref:Retrotransposon Copia-like N-terminal domain-containing protein n=1 Tax=Nyssa sinensis TaxID=561372 RepID=A0A5J5AL14_9ASTE|nr:hypothetical protein F0562_005211 [Nyssa sinensis]
MASSENIDPKTPPLPKNPNERFLNFSDPFNPFRIDNGDNPATALVSNLLTADNYVNWSRAISRALRAKNKLGFINRTISKPQDATDPTFEAWERNAIPPLCTHCNMSGHYVAKCYKTHGYPLGHKLHEKNKTFAAAAAIVPSQACSATDHDEESSETMAFTKGQYNQLLALMHSKDLSSAMATMFVTPPSPPALPIPTSKLSDLGTFHFLGFF